MIVVDASLAAKWFLNEADSDQARRFLNDKQEQLCAPDIITIELARALVAAVTARRVDARFMRGVISAWLETVTIEVLNLYGLDTRLMQGGVDIALELGHPLPDCIYLALAIELDCNLATCDAKFQAKAASFYPRVKLLSDFS